MAPRKTGTGLSGVLLSTQNYPFTRIAVGLTGCSIAAAVAWTTRGPSLVHWVTLGIYHFILLARALILRSLDGDSGINQLADERTEQSAWQAGYMGFWVLITAVMILTFSAGLSTEVSLWVIALAFLIGLVAYSVAEIYLRKMAGSLNWMTRVYRQLLLSTKSYGVNELVLLVIVAPAIMALEWRSRGMIPRYPIIMFAFGSILLLRALSLRRLDGDNGIVDTADERTLEAAWQAGYYAFWATLSVLYALTAFHLKRATLSPWWLVGIFTLGLAIYVSMELRLRRDNE